MHFSDIIYEIDNDRPIYDDFYNATFNSAHAVVIRGYNIVSSIGGTVGTFSYMEPNAADYILGFVYSTATVNDFAFVMGNITYKFRRALADFKLI